MEDEGQAIAQIITAESSRKEAKGSCFAAIPDEILSEILSRLPTKNVFQLQCVCRRWRSLLSHHSFAKLHISRLNPSPSWALFIPSISVDNPCSSSSFSPPDKNDPKVILQHFNLNPKISLNLQPHRIVAACDGLLLCTDLTISNYFIVNPITRAYVLIPPPPPQSTAPSGHGLIVQFDQSGLIFESFRVVLVCQESISCSGLTKNRIVFLNFYSGDGEWRSRHVPCPPGWLRTVGDFSIPPPTPLAGVLYWVVWSNATVIAYDPFKNPHDCSWIRLPGRWGVPAPDGRENYFCLCGNMHGRFSFFDRTRLWVLQGYNEGDWREDLSVRPAEEIYADVDRLSGFSNVFPFPLAFNPFAKNVVISHSYSLLSVNLETSPLRFLRSLPYALLVYKDVFPLVLPQWPSLSVPFFKCQQEIKIEYLMI